MFKLRPFATKQLNLVSRSLFRPIRFYHSYDHLNADDLKEKALVEDLKSIILTESIKSGNIRTYGFNRNSVDVILEEYQKKTGTESTNYSVLFRKGQKGTEMMNHYLDYTRLLLKKEVEHDNSYFSAKFSKPEFTVTDRLKYLIKKRIEYNVKYLSSDIPSPGINSKLHANLKSLLSTLILPTNFINSSEQLYALSDDLLFYAGDKSYSFDWYEKRFKIASIFVKSELFMLSDNSEGFEKTLQFVEEQLNLYDNVNYAVDSINQWALINGFSLLNLIKSQLSRG